MRNSKEKIIIWQKWRDPFGEKDDSIDIDNEYSDFDNYDDYDEDQDHQKQSNVEELLNNKQIKVIATPMGIVPINENTASGKIFNFWVGHTNFNITKDIFRIIENTDGVETLDIFTRYRFRIGIGKAFNDSNVMNHIQEDVYSYIETIDDKED
jgi:hypothetical protein